MEIHTVLLSRSEIASLMDLDAYYAAVEAAFRAHAEGRATIPLPLHIPVEDGGFHAKGAYWAPSDLGESRVEAGYVAVKVNSNFPGNPARGLPTIQGAVLLYDALDGRLLGILDSMEITARRTAAAASNDPAWKHTPPPAPEVEFDQRITW